MSKFKSGQHVKFFLKSAGRYHYGTLTKQTAMIDGKKNNVVLCPALAHWPGDEGMWVETASIEPYELGDEKLQAAHELEYITRQYKMSEPVYKEIKRIAELLGGDAVHFRKRVGEQAE